MAGIILGLSIGLVAGAIQFYLLFKFVTSVTGGKVSTKTIMFAITQFFFPFLILVICAFLIGDSLMWVGIGIASALIIGAIIRFIIVSKQPPKNDIQSKK